MFLDDDDELDSQAVFHYVTAISKNQNIAVFTSFSDLFLHSQDEIPKAGMHADVKRWSSLGSAVEVAFAANVLGGYHCAVNISSQFWKISNGYSSDASTGCEDWEFLLKAALYDSLLLVPVRGIWYRKVQKHGETLGMLAESLENPLLQARCRARVAQGGLDFLNMYPIGRASLLVSTFQYLQHLNQLEYGADW
jgi:hypothetical protein